MSFRVLSVMLVCGLFYCDFAELALGQQQIYYVGDQSSARDNNGTASYHDGNNWLNYLSPGGVEGEGWVDADQWLSPGLGWAFFDMSTDYRPGSTGGNPPSYYGRPNYIYFGDFFDNRSGTSNDKSVPGGDALPALLSVVAGDYTFDLGSNNGGDPGGLSVIGWYNFDTDDFLRGLLNVEASQGRFASLKIVGGVVKTDDFEMWELSAASSARVTISGAGAGLDTYPADVGLEPWMYPDTIETKMYGGELEVLDGAVFNSTYVELRNDAKITLDGAGSKWNSNRVYFEEGSLHVQNQAALSFTWLHFSGHGDNLLRISSQGTVEANEVSVFAAEVTGMGSVLHARFGLEVDRGGSLRVSDGAIAKIGRTLDLSELEEGEIDVAAGGAIEIGNVVGSTPAGSMRIGELGAFEGSGTIKGDLVADDGVVRLYNFDTCAQYCTPEELVVDGDVVQGALNTLRFRIGADGNDRIDVSGDVSLGGKVEVNLFSGYAPTLGSSIPLMTVDGSFSAENANFLLPALPAGLAFEQQFSDGVFSLNVVAAGPTLQGDFNADGKVDAADYTKWRDGLGTKYTSADYGIWKSQFGQSGGGALSEAAAVPEPGMMGLAAVAVAMYASCCRHRR